MHRIIVTKRGISVTSNQYNILDQYQTLEKDTKRK